MEATPPTQCFFSSEMSRLEGQKSSSMPMAILNTKSKKQWRGAHLRFWIFASNGVEFVRDTHELHSTDYLPPADSVPVSRGPRSNDSRSDRFYPRPLGSCRQHLDHSGRECRWLDDLLSA